MSKLFGYQLLRQQSLDHVAGEADWMIEEKKVGDSEIEKLLFLALTLRVQIGATEYTSILAPTDYEAEKRLKADTLDPQCTLFVRPQAVINNYRVDFLVSALAVKDQSSDQRVWRRLVVECDGHEFHERTKEQAAKDRSRDRDLVSMGYDVFRFTGSELWRDPWKCAQQVLEWGIIGW